MSSFVGTSGGGASVASGVGGRASVASGVGGGASVASGSVPPRAIPVHIQLRNNCYIYVGQLISSQGMEVFVPGEDHRHVGIEEGPGSFGALGHNLSVPQLEIVEDKGAELIGRDLYNQINEDEGCHQLIGIDNRISEDEGAQLIGRDLYNQISFKTA
ncbi:hypothetical protein PVK06_011214 [Gossypium arboreum]|uniref:Uncharacterized protein n=1 Tax=Gossypium arboreum TaxID=29729 RepID=A0ABR0Q9G2_GOSAR|nr:hypothetical protein PVK06_011214 [Gossypium arboreum]